MKKPDSEKMKCLQECMQIQQEEVQRLYIVTRLGGSEISRWKKQRKKRKKERNKKKMKSLWNGGKGKDDGFVFFLQIFVSVFILTSIFCALFFLG